MRILVLAYHYPPIVASVNRTYNIVKYLSKRGHKVYVLSAKPTGLDYVDLSLQKKLKNVSVHRTTNINNSITQFFSRIVKILPDGELWPIFLRWFAPIQSIKKFNPDIIFASMKPGYTSIVASFISKKLGIPYILDYRDPWYPPFYIKKLHKKSVLGAQSVITVTDDCKSIIKNQSGREDIIVIENGTSTKEVDTVASKNFDDNYLHICYTGAITPRHKIDALIHAVSRLPKKIKENISLEIVGKARSLYKLHERGLRKFVTKNEVRANFYGYLPKDETYSILKGSNIAYNGQAYVFSNAMGGKTYEYLAAGKPILALTRKSTPISILIDKYNIGWNAYNLGELKETIKHIYLNKKQIELYSKNAKKIRKKYDWNTLLIKLDKLLSVSQL